MEQLQHKARRQPLPRTRRFRRVQLVPVDDTLFFSSSGPEGSSNGYELWRWGNDVGTKLFKNLFPDRYITNQSIEIDETTGIKTLTIETAEFNTTNPEFSSDSFPGNFTRAGNGNFFFTAYSTQKIEAVVDGFADEINWAALNYGLAMAQKMGLMQSQSTKKHMRYITL